MGRNPVCGCFDITLLVRQLLGQREINLIYRQASSVRSLEHSKFRTCTHLTSCAETPRRPPLFEPLCVQKAEFNIGSDLSAQ